MKVRTRLLVCGYEPEQIAGRTVEGYGEERWWVHAAAYSAQGPYSLPWWPVPADTVKGDLFLVRLAAFDVPDGLRSELSAGKIELGRGVAGTLAQEAIEYTGFPLFGGGSGDIYVDLPGHPEFDPNRRTLGGGLAGLAVAHSAATPITEFGDGKVYEARVGTFVPLPDVIGEELVRGRFGRALDDLTTPMGRRGPDQINVSPDDFEALIAFILDRYPGDDWLRDSIHRLKEVAACLAQPTSYFPTGLSPTPSWSSEVGGSGSGTGASPSSLPPGFIMGSASGGGGGATPRASEMSPGDQRVETPEPGGGESEDLLDDLFGEIFGEYVEWVLGERGGDDRPLALEQIAIDDGRGDRRYFKPPTTDAEEPHLATRLLQVITVMKEFFPDLSVALLVHEEVVYFIAARDAGDAPGIEVVRSEIPAPGEQPSAPTTMDLSEVITSRRSDGPYGEEAVQVAAHVLGDLFEKLQAWAADERSERDLPLEQVMYDGGEVWRHMDVPPTEISRPSLAARIKELIPVLVEVAPSPAVISFNHRKKHYLLSSFNTAPGEMVIRVLKFDIPPPGSLFGDPEELDPSKLGIA
jgi:hypothetical protein